MDDDHVVADKIGNKKVDSIFSLFSDLIGEKNENPRHCLALIKSLRGNEFSVGSGSNLEYSVKRLLRGLGSFRATSQCSCFAALTCILKYQACSVETVMEVLEKEQNPVHGATKSELRALTSSCVLACGAIIHSGLFDKQSTQVQENILNKLIEARKKKSYLFPVIIQLLIDVVNLVEDEQLKNIVWPICKSELLQNLTECSPDVYYLLLICFEKNEKLINKFLHKNSISSNQLLEFMVKSLLSHAKCDHPIFNNIGQFFCKNASTPVDLWSKFVNENSKMSSQRDTVVITLFTYIIKNLKEVTIIPKLLVPKFLETLIKVLSVKKTPEAKGDGNSAAKFALNTMMNVLCAESTSNETRFQCVKKLLFYPGNLKFEMKTGTKCINTLVSQLSCEYTKKLANLYQKVVSGELRKKIDEDGAEENWNGKEKQYALHHFTKTLNHPSLRKEIDWKLSGTRFIFEAGFLNKYQLTSEVQKCAKDSFYRAITVQMPSLIELILFLDELTVFVNESIKNKEFKMSKEVENYWDKMYSIIETLKKKTSSKLYSAVHVFLIYMGLHLFADFELAKGGIEELLSCHEKLKETQKKKKLEEDGSSPHWTEVTVDLILSLLSRENKLWRHVVSIVFPQVVSQITPTALNQIIDALDSKSRNDVLRHVNSDDSELETDEESESSLSDEKDSDSEEAEDEIKPNDQLRFAVRNALGYSAAQTDDESIDMDQMDEEEERRLNESLSEAFRQFRNNSHSKKKKQSREEEALAHFRLRVLDLIEIYIANSPPMGACLDLLVPLFDLLELSIKDYHQKPLQNRVDSIMKHLLTVKTFSNTENVNQTIIKEVFESVISRKETSALVFVEMSPRISDCTTFLVRCSQQIPNDGTCIPLVEEYESLLKAFFHSRDYKLPISMFQAILRTSWKGNFKIVATLFKLLVSPDVRIFKKIKIIELLRIFYKNEKLRWSSDQIYRLELAETETDFVRDFINFVSEYEKTEAKATVKMYLSFFSNIIALINVIISSCRKRSEEKEHSKNIRLWRSLVEKMTETEAIISNKKTRSQLGNLANAFKLELPTNEKLIRKRTLSELSDQVKEENKSEEQERKKKKKKLSNEKQKLKKESRKLREKISSNGLDMVRFSTVNFSCLPESVDDEDEEEDKEEPKTPRKKRRGEKPMNGVA